MKKLAVIPGSFDPITRGHAEIIRRAVGVFGACEVVVMNNREKTTRFSLEERTAFCRAALAGEKNVSVSAYEGMLYEFLAGRESAVLVKGVRNGEDLLYERTQAAFNFDHCGVETVFLDAGDAWQDVSSTRVRALLDEGGDWQALVPEAVIPLLEKTVRG